MGLTGVVLSDAEPMRWSEDAGSSSFEPPEWFSWRKIPQRYYPRTRSASELPDELFYPVIRANGGNLSPNRMATRFATFALALAALSSAALSLCRTAAGLPPLTDPASV